MQYKTKGVCSRTINVDVKDNTVEHVEFIGGCNGNLQGISRLVQGMNVEEAISKLEGIHCDMKETSCPDQLAQALKKYLH